jgi:hypothetical protein
VDQLLPLWNLISRFDWSSLLSALIGGGFGLLASSKRCRDRQHRREEEKANVKRDTPIALRDSPLIDIPVIRGMMRLPQTVLHPALTGA